MQSLHTAVQDPDASPLEVQIRTQVQNLFQVYLMSHLSEIEIRLSNSSAKLSQRMHEYAEHGLAAHWLYKETGNDLLSISVLDESEIEESSYLPEDLDDQNSMDYKSFLRYSSLKVGHPVLRVEGSNLLAAVIIKYFITLYLMFYCLYLLIFTFNKLVLEIASTE